MFLQVSVCPQGGGCLPQCMLGCHTPPGIRQTPPLGPGRPPGTRQTPLGPGRPPRDQPDLGYHTPLDQADTPPDQANPPGTSQTWDAIPPLDQADTPPPDQADPLGPGRPPPGNRLQHTVYEQPVRILLECILVLFCCHISASNCFCLVPYLVFWCTIQRIFSLHCFILC